MYKLCGIALALALLLGVLVAAPAQAALKPKGSVTMDEAWNPAPSAGDVTLPMPCDLGMVFRVAAVPSKGFLWDMTTRMGRDDGAHADRAFYDSRHTTALSGPFGAEDLPAAWRAGLPTGNYHYYLIGKYEVSGLQWKAVMDAACPAKDALAPEDARPRTDVSWYDAVEFSRRYTEWLLKNHPGSLPRFRNDERNVGFVRLPTEAEWEYAARGGQAVTSQWLVEEDFFPLPEGATMADFAVFRPEDAARIEEHPSRIGARKPNPLGLHDTAGNVAEMVMDPFRFSLGGRLHGSAGGFVRKGGSYLSGTAEVMPGRREEVAFFQQDGPVHTRDMGFRLVISGINTPGGDRPAALREEWKKAGEDSALLLDNTRNPLEEIDRLLSMARTDAERENLQRLRGILKDNNIALERHQSLAAESLVRTAAFMIETIRNFAIRRNVADMQIREMEKLRAESQKKNMSVDEKLIAKAKEIRATLERGLNQSLSFYVSKLQDVRNLAPAILDGAMRAVEKDLAQGDDFSRKLQDNIRIYEKHVRMVRARQAVDKQRISDDILPAKK